MRFALPLLLALLLAAPAAAHGFHLELRVQAGVIQGEAYFSDGEPPGEGTWRVFHAAGGEALASGQLDTSGHFRWEAPALGRYRCEVKEVGLHVASAEVDVKVTAPGASSAPSATPSPPAGSAQSESESDTARRPKRGRGGRARLKRLLTGLGGIALLGVGLFRFQRRRGAGSEEDADEGTEEADEAGSSDKDTPDATPPSASSGDA